MSTGKKRDEMLGIELYENLWSIGQKSIEEEVGSRNFSTGFMITDT